MCFQAVPSPAKLYTDETYHESIMRKLSADLAVPIKVASVAAGSALGGFAGKQIGGLAGRAVPVIGGTIGKATGKYIGVTLGGLAGEVAGDKLAEVIVPAVLDAAEPGYIRVDVREDHRPPKFFERMMDH
ncbi:hypothetical protein O0S10_07815 [Methanocorpusculum sp. MG]|uniref:Glycine zipper 2TM domain-containing protein n=1 Tax=Methanocorpusculum petauri TaxID=3002863 RepID=A0ABT4IHA3_9EURY|nr:hypothetical protein [Methanocorpusculum petauri]MCZ0861128.1 hypothetical protein [Methanocorpusculum petauri]